MQMLSRWETGTSPRSAPQEKKNVSEERGKLPGRPGGTDRRLEGASEVCISGLGALLLRYTDHRDKTEFCCLHSSSHPKQNAEAGLPHPLPPCRLPQLSKHALFVLLNPFFSPLKPPYLLCPRLGLQWSSE